jgi:hypothetical protein
MRYGLIAILFLLCGLLLTACGPLPAARRSVDQITKATQRTELELKRATRQALLDVATAEGQARGQALQAVGCGPATATQPSSALIDPCRQVVADSEQRYEARAKAIMGPARKVDQAIGTVYASLLVVLDLVEDLEAGLKPGGWEQKLAGLVAEAVKLAADVVTAFTAWKATAGGMP